MFATDFTKVKFLPQPTAQTMITTTAAVPILDVSNTFVATVAPETTITAGDGVSLDEKGFLRPYGSWLMFAGFAEEDGTGGETITVIHRWKFKLDVQGASIAKRGRATVYCHGPRDFRFVENINSDDTSGLVGFLSVSGLVVVDR